MASLLERIQNLFDDRQDFEREKARQDGYVSGLHDTRGALLSSALAMQYEWRREIKIAGPNGNHEAINAKYPARLHGLNDAFAALRQGDHSVATEIDVEQFKKNATERVSYQSQEHSFATSGSIVDTTTAFLTEEAYMKLPTAPVNSATRITGHSGCSVLSCEFSDSRGAAASRLLFRFTLDPLSGSTQVYRFLSGTFPFRSTGVYL